jgi:hypothetical protein
MTVRILILLSTFTLGIFLGTQLAEAMLIVPYWKAMPANDFFAFYKAYGKQLHLFYAPLTIVATLLPVAAFLLSLFGLSRTDRYMWLMAVFSILFFAMFFIYFKEANRSFAERSIKDQALPQELVKWGNWHWGRVVCEFFAFVCGLLLLLRLKLKNQKEY